MEKRILVVDDDKDLSYIIKTMLEGYGYQCTCAYNCEEAYEQLTIEQYHLILLDINLGDSSGFDICKEIRQVSTIPIIFASARTAETDRITGLDIGGDDYLEKPYSLKELLSHVNAVMRRSYGFTKEEEIIQIGDLKINLSSRQVFLKDMELTLSLKEFDVLAYLATHQKQVVTKEELLSNVWGTFCEVEPSTVAVHISWLRQKLEADAANPVYIKTIWGKGYRMG